MAVPAGVISRLRSVVTEKDDGNEVVHTQDITRPSFGFKARPGDSFIVSGGAFDGFMALLVDISRLDGSGEVTAWIDLFGQKNTVKLPYRSVGRVIGGSRESVAA